MRSEGALLALLATLPLPAAAATLTVEVGNVRNANGHVRIDLCTQAHFLKDDCAYSGDAPAHVGATLIRLQNVPPGRYAIQAFHDENDNRHVDRALFGIPKEGVGFSNDAPIRLGPPKWEAAMVSVVADTTLRLKLRYFLGASGPDAAAR